MYVFSSYTHLFGEWKIQDRKEQHVPDAVSLSSSLNSALPLVGVHLEGFF